MMPAPPPPGLLPDWQASARAALGLVDLVACGSVPCRSQLAGHGGLLAAVVAYAGSGNAATAEAALRVLSHLTCAGRVTVCLTEQAQ
jgi:hypothetical protein